jgi:hypothetical protein
MPSLAPDRVTPLFMQYYDFGLVKADEQASEAAPWVIWIRASTQDVDFDHERVSQQALKDAADYFVRNGRITWEHVTQEKRYDPSIIVGEPMAVQFPADGSTLVQARLYPLQPNAQHIWNILRSGGKLKASIGGSCAKRPGRDGILEIAQIFWNHLALTPYPVNDHTDVSLQPYSQFVKALGASAAASLVQEDLQGAREANTASLVQRWQALTEILMQQQPGLSEEEAKRAALLLLIKRGATRQAYTAAHWAPQPTPGGLVWPS